MRFGMVSLINYKRIYNGLNLYRLDIDFKKCTNDIVVIKGLNGSGKSSLMDALHPLPDSNDDIIDNLEGCKQMEIFGLGNIYNISIVYPLTNKGDRATTKAYFNKNGTELNPNGNISFYKEILESEFGLDSVFLSLSMVSVENRGIVEKSPAERKRFVAHMLNSLEAYNNMNKKISKKYNDLKMIMNNLTSKLNSLGDELLLNNTLVQINNNLSSLNLEKDKLIQELGEYKAKISSLDPTNKILEEYNNILKEITNIDSKVKILEEDISKNNISNPVEYEKQLNREIIEKDKQIAIKINEHNRLKRDQDSLALELSKKISDLNKYKHIDNIDIINNMDMLLKDITEKKDILNKLNINQYDISEDDIMNIMQIMDTCSTIMDNIYNNFDISTIENSINSRIDYIKNIDSIDSTIKDCNEILNELVGDFNAYHKLKEEADKLKSRPKNCKIDTCPFILYSIDAYKKNPEDNINKIENKIDETKKKIALCNKEKNSLMNSMRCKEYINTLNSVINNNRNLLMKNKVIADYFFNINENILIRKEIPSKQILINILENINIINILNNNIRLSETHMGEYKEYEKNKYIINTLEKEIEILNRKNKDYTFDGIEVLNFIDKLKQEKNQIQYDIDICNTCISIDNEKNILLSNRNDLMIKYSNIKDSIQNIKKYNEGIKSLSIKYDEIMNMINSVEQERDNIKFNIRSIGEYKKEMEMYNTEYSKLEELKYYSSYSTGIQLVYINMYMGKTMRMVNEFLSLLYNNTFNIMEFTINEREFRIPCMIDGILRDDISSLSTSQKCMVSMILSFVLLYQSSMTYGILRLDEIDSGLDEVNRRNFIELVRQQMKMLNVEQCILISHNNELDLLNNDLILLKTQPGSVYEGNVIYRYN